MTQAKQRKQFAVVLDGELVGEYTNKSNARRKMRAEQAKNLGALAEVVDLAELEAEPEEEPVEGDVVDELLEEIEQAMGEEQALAHTPPDEQTLPDNMAELINEEHRAVQNAGGIALEHAMRAGAMLVAKKEELPHGEFMDWVKANCEFSDRTANDYMKLHRRREEVEANSQRAADLSIRGALKAIAPPPKPKPKKSVPPREQRAGNVLEQARQRAAERAEEPVETPAELLPVSREEFMQER